MVSPEIGRWPLWRIIESLRHGEMTSPEIVDGLLSTISKLDPTVLAFTTVTDEIAHKQAQDAQHRLDCEGAQAPLLTGLPVVLKDLIDVRGVITTAGSRVLENNIAAYDSALWTDLRKQDAVLLGKANTHEFAYGGASAPTRNPWDLSKVPGGSSGGSAAALAAGMCHAAFGTDTAGSVRIPAALCGVTGLKPTNGTFNTRGVVPLSQTLDVIGPMARSPRDVRLLFQALHAGSALSLTWQPDVRGLRVGVVQPQGSVASPVIDGLKDAAEALREAGAVVHNVDLSMCLEDAAGVNFTIMGAEASAIHQHWLATQPESYSDAVRARIREAESISARDYILALGRRDEFRSQLDDALDGCDVLLLNGLPSQATPAYDEDIELDGSTQNRDWIMCRDMAFANVTGHPVLEVPAGCPSGLPVGVQLVARQGMDDVLFAPGESIFERLAQGIPEL